ncbi:MAG: hypothetical protein A4E49_00102 [Methanosaeta sp. PtaU1.Bin112]|nr:MAG: hypothetical protein A4E49_00102 [Methanosaeta sp. PtaU1.Bin112]
MLLFDPFASSPGGGDNASVALIVKWNVEPLPSSDSAQIEPFMSSTSLLLIARPRPAPPYLRVVQGSTWQKD